MWIGIVATFLGCVIVAEIGRRAASGGLGRNHLAGIRTTATLASDETWAAAHEAAGNWMLWTGVTAAAGMLVVAGLAIVGVGEAWIASGILGVAGWLTVGALVACVRGDRAARSVLEQH